MSPSLNRFAWENASICIIAIPKRAPSSSGSTPPGRSSPTALTAMPTPGSIRGFASSASENPLYTALDQYFRCRFLYYLERVLGISRVRNEEALFIGNLFHNLLEALLVEDPEEPEEFLKRKLAEYLQEENIELNAREEFFAGKYLEVLLRFRRFLKLEEETSSLKTVALEKSFRIPLRDGFVLEGKIDKIQSFSHDGEEYYVVVDYKSGNADIDLGRIVYGLNLQIPLYFYLLKHAGLSAKFGGGYLQRVLPNTVFGRDPRFSYEEQFFRFFRKTDTAPTEALLEIGQELRAP